MSDLAALPGARRAAMPGAIEPQLASVAGAVPDGDEWLHEIKLDGYRLLATFDKGEVRLVTRHGLDWTKRFEGLARALRSAPIKQAILDGEVVVLDEHGISSFQALQNALQKLPGKRREMTFFAFDLLYVDGWDLRDVGLEKRKQVLRQLIPSNDQTVSALRFSDHVIGHGPASRDQACRMGLEGIVCKRRDAIYRSGRTTTWLKAKCAARQEFVIGGFTDPAGSREHFGALLLGLYEGGELRYAGRCGSGFSEASLRELYRRLRPLEQKQPAYRDPPRGTEARGVHWLKPSLVAEVAFTGFTDDGRARHAIFQGLREDKSVTEVKREQPPSETVEPRGQKMRTESEQPPTRRTRQPAPTPQSTVKLSHPDRILYPEQGLTKQDLANYYALVADLMLPHAAERALTLVRCPEGHAKTCFFQKHIERGLPKELVAAPMHENGADVTYLAVKNSDGILALVQMGVLEIHLWGSRIDRPAAPDRLVFDLDPDTDVGWSSVVEAAQELRGRLSQLGLQSFVKSTGGKGLHVVVPVTRNERQFGWDRAKAFCRALAQTMERDAPTRYLSTASKAKRKGKIYIDYLRNGWGATSVAAYSTRARPGAPVSAPLAWEELATFDPKNPFTILSMPDRIAKHRDPWTDLPSIKQRLPAELLKL